MPIPTSLLFRHGLMIKTLLSIVWQSKVQPGKRPQHNPAHFAPVQMSVPAPTTDLVRLYAQWCGAPIDKYRQSLPPHLFSQFALPVCAQQLRQTRYDLSGIINQGCGLKISQPLRPGLPIQVHCDMVDIREDNGRARIHQHLRVHNEGESTAYEVDFHTTVIIGKRQKKEPRSDERCQWREAGTWHASRKAGWEFALLTGDFNPLHWLQPIARLTPFRGTILHGFGSFARSFEMLEQDGRRIGAIDVRFVGPVKLPSDNIRVQFSEQSDNDDYHQIRQVGNDDRVQLSGRCQFL